MEGHWRKLSKVESRGVGVKCLSGVNGCGCKMPIVDLRAVGVDKSKCRNVKDEAERCAVWL